RGRAVLIAAGGGRLSVDESLGAVALVGDGINRDVRVLRRALDVLDRHRVSAHGVVTTAFRVSVLIDRGAVESTTRALHDEFVAADGTPVALEDESAPV